MCCPRAERELHVVTTAALRVVQAQLVPASQVPQRSARLPQSRRPHLTGAGAGAGEITGEGTGAGEATLTTQMRVTTQLAATPAAITPTAATSQDGQR